MGLGNNCRVCVCVCVCVLGGCSEWGREGLQAIHSGGAESEQWRELEDAVIYQPCEHGGEYGGGDDGW